MKTLLDLRDTWEELNVHHGNSFITLNIINYDSNHTISSVTIPYARFAKSEDLPYQNLWELRSCDCREHVDHIPKIVYVTEESMKQYVFDRASLHHFIFSMTVRPM